MRSLISPLVLSLCLMVSAGAARAEAPLMGSGPELDRDLPEGFHRLSTGDRAPDFKLMGVDDKVHSLAEFASSKYLLVVFLSNHCPFSHAAETRLIPWVNAMRSKGLAVVAIQPNHPDALTIDELDYARYSDSFAEMKLYAADRHFPFPYLYDGDTQQVAKSYGALATPDLFLFDQDRKLRYSGRFDDSRFEDPQSVTHHDAINAMNDLIEGREVAVPATRPMGCSVKWLTKVKRAASSNQGAWDHLPITLEPITAAAVAELVKNPTHKLRLINVWATWCAPCVSEFPEIAKLSHRFARREFEVVTLSMDKPDDHAKALRFLEAQHAGMSRLVADSLVAEHRTTNNYIYADSGIDALVQALDPQWPGPLPYTILVAPGGAIVWRHNGAVDPNALVNAVLDQLGVYYPKN